MSDYVEYVVGQLANFGVVKVRAMFGGFGIYKDGTILGIVIENELYFKTDQESEKEYRFHESEPFSYQRDGKVITMSYWKVPEQILENREKLHEFASTAYAISLKSKKGTKK